MNTSERIVLKKLLFLSKGEVLLKFLLAEEKRQIEKLSTPFFDEKLNTLAQKSLIDFVHYSWFMPILKKYSDNEKACFLTIFSKSNAQKLQNTLNIPHSSEEPSPIAKKFLLNILISFLLPSDNDLLSINFLPSSPLNFLILKTKEELIEIIDYLSLFDLHKAFSQIVNRDILDKINNFLSPNQKQFLKSNLKEPFYFPPLNLKTWDGNMPSLQNILHKRGLLRFKMAMFQQDKSFVWYISHMLDIGRGGVLMKYNEKNEDVSICKSILKNVEDISSFLHERRK
jgi:hypothetical protein